MRQSICSTPLRRVPIEEPDTFQAPPKAPKRSWYARTLAIDDAPTKRQRSRHQKMAKKVYIGCTFFYTGPIDLRAFDLFYHQTAICFLLSLSFCTRQKGETQPRLGLRTRLVNSLADLNRWVEWGIRYGFARPISGESYAVPVGYVKMERAWRGGLSMCGGRRDEIRLSSNRLSKGKS